MPIGIVSDEELQQELENGPSDENSVGIPQVEIKEKERGRGNGNVAIPEALQRTIGQTAIEEGREEAIALADKLGISKSSVSAYTNGAASTSSYNEPHPAIGPHISTVKNKIATRARSKLLKSLKAINKTKLEESSARELAGVAKDLSAIADKMESDKSDGPNVSFVLVTPRQKKMEQFEVIDVEE